MNATELKNKAIADIQLIVDMAIEQAETRMKNDKNGFSLESFFEMKNPKIQDKKEDAINEYLRLSDNDNELYDIWNFEYDNLKISFPAEYAVYLTRQIKNGFVECPKLGYTNTSKIDRRNSKNMQLSVEQWRNEYQGYNYSEESKEPVKNGVIKEYKKAKPNDLIRLCWKYITDPKKTEGVNIPYAEEPKVVFTPYFEEVEA